MDVRYITQHEGYRYEDLSEKSKHEIDCFNYILDKVDEVSIEDDDILAENTLGKIKQEIAEDVINTIKEHLETCILEMQIALAEQDKEDSKE
ncbi:hypothetical protein [Methanobrevibacter sp.]|uniref:hypothetical protein n=1 Tax=Methanobrevibacter sp. TaxID=66852 RepID=UPI00388E91D9